VKKIGKKKAGTSSSSSQEGKNPWILTDAIKLSICGLQVLVAVYQLLFGKRLREFRGRRRYMRQKASAISTGPDTDKKSLQWTITFGLLVQFFWILGSHAPMYFGWIWTSVGETITVGISIYIFGTITKLTSQAEGLGRNLGKGSGSENPVRLRSNYVTCISILVVFNYVFLTCLVLTKLEVFLLYHYVFNAIGLFLLGVVWLWKHIQLLKMMENTDDIGYKILLGDDDSKFEYARSPLSPEQKNQRIVSKFQRREKLRIQCVQHLKWTLPELCIPLAALITIAVIMAATTGTGIHSVRVDNQSTNYDWAWDSYCWVLLVNYASFQRWARTN